jgi:predicted transcriptional regulator
LDVLKEGKRNVSEIARLLSIPQSTAVVSIKVLKAAGLVDIEMAPGRKGSQKICSLPYDEVVIQLPSMNKEVDDRTVEVQMPVGLYTDFEVSPPCGLCSREKIIGFLDVPSSFLSPERSTADLVWFEKGFLEYKFPNNMPKGEELKSLGVVMEVCSEVPGTSKQWPSDITIWINGVEVGTWTSPGDFGDKRGKLTPAWWKLAGSQYGLLKSWNVTNNGSFIDGIEFSNVKLKDLEIHDHTSVKVRIGIKEGSKNVGGINVFGKGFGNYAQDILLRMEFV